MTAPSASHGNEEGCCRKRKLFASQFVQLSREFTPQPLSILIAVQTAAITEAGGTFVFAYRCRGILRATVHSESGSARTSSQTRLRLFRSSQVTNWNPVQSTHSAYLMPAFVHLTRRCFTNPSSPTHANRSLKPEIRSPFILDLDLFIGVKGCSLVVGSH